MQPEAGSGSTEKMRRLRGRGGVRVRRTRDAGDPGGRIRQSTRSVGCVTRVSSTVSRGARRFLARGVPR